MLMSLGSVVFEVHPFNTHEYGHDHGADFVDKPVVGGPRPLEFVGEGDVTWTIRFKIFPKEFGGMNDLARLNSIRASGDPVYLMRGDGRPLGFVAVLSVTEKSSYLDRDGVGRVIEGEVRVKKTGRPSVSAFTNMFG